MPLFFQHVIDDTTQLALWKIAEEETFFTQHVPLQRTISHPHKRLQHLAGRYLLKYLFPDFPLALIQIADTRKPFLENEAYHFSISHCGDYAGVIVSKTKRVGIDIELVNDKIGRIQHKFVSEQEWKRVAEQWELLENNVVSPHAVNLLTLLWSCKEAGFKWYGDGEVGFIRHMEIMGIDKTSDGYQLHLLFKKNEDLLLDLHSRFFDNLLLSYVTT